jgi:hypothetical protein
MILEARAEAKRGDNCYLILTEGSQPGWPSHIKKRVPDGSLLIVAEWTGFEPATPGVTGRYSNQLNYHSESWWVLTGSNRRPSPCKGDALPAELSTRNGHEKARKNGLSRTLCPLGAR